MNELNSQELRILSRLNTAQKLQDFVNRIPMNFEIGRETCLSPRMVLRERRAHCMEGAMLAAVALRLHGSKPLVIDLKAACGDFDHVVAVYKENNAWGAISKTNHGVLRYREPIYRTIRELAISYFHEYLLNDGRKTLRSYTNPIDLSALDAKGWMTAEKDVWYVPRYLDHQKHIPLMSRLQIAKLRRADPIERRIGRMIEWPKKRA